MLSHVGADESGPISDDTHVFCIFHTLKVGHVGPDVRVQGVDDHLAVSWAGNLNAPVDEARRRRSTLPRIVLTDVLGLWQEVEQVSLVELGLAKHASLEQGFSALVECAVEKGQEDTGVLAENVAVLVIEVAEDVDLSQDPFGIDGHCAVGIYQCAKGWAGDQGTRRDEEQSSPRGSVRRRPGGRPIIFMIQTSRILTPGPRDQREWRAKGGASAEGSFEACDDAKSGARMRGSAQQARVWWLPPAPQTRKRMLSAVRVRALISV